MKLSDHVEVIRSLIYKSFNNQFSRLGIGPNKELEIEKIPNDVHSKRNKISVLIKSHTVETVSYSEAREKALDELTFTLFNRLASIKVMEAHQLFPPIITKESEHGDRSFGHKVWLEEQPEMRNEELEGMRSYFKDEFNKLGESIPLFNKNYPYALLPYVIELNEIVDAFNAVAQDPQVADNIWQSDDILGWLYESYNNVKKQAHKDSKDKTEYNKVSLQSQVYTPRWVVEFLVQNSLGKMYLEMYPDSDIKNQFKIANAPQTKVRDVKPLHEIKLIDPASGSGNFLLYAFEFFYQLYQDQIDNYGADYDEDAIAQLIIENNLHGIDLDDRAIQLAQLGLWIKAKQKQRNIGSLKFNVVSSDFFLVDFDFVYPIFKQDITDTKQLAVIESVWKDLQDAHKFGSLVKLNEKIDAHLSALKNSDALLFSEQEEEDNKAFKQKFLANLEKAFLRFATQQGNSFLTDKTKDAITFLKLITQKYDVAAANPPYTDSGDFGPDLKKFIEANFKKPYKFNTNLYATFIKRCFELTNEKGKVAMVHPPTFMYIKTFEDVRKYMLEKSHIDIFVEWGYLGMFHPSARVDAAMYILDKEVKKTDTTFIKLNHIYEGKRYEGFVDAYDSLVENNKHSNIYNIPQPKLKIIKSYPFIYWISDEFREKFKDQTVEKIGAAKPGLQTGLNERFLRFWWEIDKENFLVEQSDNKKWVSYAKGGDFNKWAGNLWLKVNWQNDGNEIKSIVGPNGRQKSRPQNSQYYFKEGITYSASGSRGGTSFRILPQNSMFDVGGASIFVNEGQSSLYAIALFNSILSNYILDCLNPSANFQKGDIDRLLYKESFKIKEEVERLSKFSISQRSELLKYSIIEEKYEQSPFKFQGNSQNDAIKNYLNFENQTYSLIIVAQAIIDNLILNSFELTEKDKENVINSQGISLGSLPILNEAKLSFINILERDNHIPKEIINSINNLPELENSENIKLKVVDEFDNLYKDNNDLESFCNQKRKQKPLFENINPINIWYWFKESKIIPKARMNDLAMEFLADMLREILMEDEDGIIPLVPNAGEKVLLDRIEEKFMEKGFSMAQYSSFDSVLGRELNEYVNNHFFKAFSDHLNLFMYLPKTPFIWHLTSGPEQGFDCYIIIYKWSRDRLMSIKSVYVEQRERALQNRQSDLRSKESLSASEQNEADKIYKQLQEIESFKKKIDELLAEGYNPILDDGVGKNIAPLQKKGMLPYAVLNSGQLKKYLNADW